MIRALRGAECWTDHRLVHTTMKLHIAPRHPKRSKLVRTPFNIARLQQPFYLQKFQTNLDEKLATKGPLTADPEMKWNQFREVALKTAKAVLGSKSRKHQDCLDKNGKEIEDLLARKNEAFMEWQNDPSPRRTDSSICRPYPIRKSERCTTSGGGKMQKRSKASQTPTTRSSFSGPSSQCSACTVTCVSTDEVQRYLGSQETTNNNNNNDRKAITNFKPFLAIFRLTNVILL